MIEQRPRAVPTKVPPLIQVEIDRLDAGEDHPDLLGGRAVERERVRQLHETVSDLLSARGEYSR